MKPLTYILTAAMAAPAALSGIAVTPMVAFAATPVSFDKGSHCGTVFTDTLNMRKYSINVKKGQRIGVGVSTNAEIDLKVRNPKGYVSSIPKVGSDEYYFTARHSGNYELIFLNTWDGSSYTPNFVACAF